MTTKTNSKATSKTSAEVKRDEKKATDSSNVEKIFKALSKTKKGLMAAEIGAEVGIEDSATVRRLTRSAGKKAETQGLKFLRETVEGNKKSYRIAK